MKWAISPLFLTEPRLERIHFFSVEALDHYEDKKPISIQRVTWKEVVSKVPPADLAPPDSGAEEKVTAEARRRMVAGA